MQDKPKPITVDASPPLPLRYGSARLERVHDFMCTVHQDEENRDL